jgi:hypothetical protein
MSVAPMPGLCPQGFVEGATRVLVGVSEAPDAESAVRAGVMRWIALVLADCSRDETALFASGPLRPLADALLARRVGACLGIIHQPSYSGRLFDWSKDLTMDQELTSINLYRHEVLNAC